MIMKLSKNVTVTLEDIDKEELIAQARDIDQGMSAEEFTDSIEAMINCAIDCALEVYK